MFVGHKGKLRNYTFSDEFSALDTKSDTLNFFMKDGKHIAKYNNVISSFAKRFSWCVTCDVLSMILKTGLDCGLSPNRRHIIILTTGCHGNKGVYDPKNRKLWSLCGDQWSSGVTELLHGRASHSTRYDTNSTNTSSLYCARQKCV